MSRRRGRLTRKYRLRVRTVRRESIDYAELARAALEHAALTQHRAAAASAPEHDPNLRPRDITRSKDLPDDRLA